VTGPHRQRAAVEDLVRRAGARAGVEAVVLIGSIAAGTADTMSDVDAIVLVDDAALAALRSDPHGLHADAVPACWDQPGGPAEVLAHKWIDRNAVLVEVLVGTPAGPLRIADPARVVHGDPAVLTRSHRRPPLPRTAMTADTHPIESAYDQLKSTVRQHRNG
jgi:hypothetical protein